MLSGSDTQHHRKALRHNSISQAGLHSAQAFKRRTRCSIVKHAVCPWICVACCRANALLSKVAMPYYPYHGLHCLSVYGFLIFTQAGWQAVKWFRAFLFSLLIFKIFGFEWEGPSFLFLPAPGDRWQLFSRTSPCSEQRCYWVELNHTQEVPLCLGWTPRALLSVRQTPDTTL